MHGGGGEPENATNKSLGLVVGGGGSHDGGEPEKSTNELSHLDSLVAVLSCMVVVESQKKESLGLIGGGGGGLHGSNHRVYCKTLVSTVNSFITHSSDNPYSLITHTFFGPLSWFTGKCIL